MESNEYKTNIGRRLRIIVRQPNGVNSVWTGLLLREDTTSLTIKTDKNEERTEPKVWIAIEWLTPVQQQEAKRGV